MCKNYKISAFLAIFALFFSGYFATAQNINPPTGRYFIGSQSSFLKTIFGVEHNFDNGFTTNLTSFQLAIIRTLGLKIEEVPYYKISAVSELSELDNRQLLPKNQIPWGLKKIYNDPNIVTSAGGKGVNVAILDTGVFKKHPDLKDRINDCKDFTKGSPIKNNCEDRNGHGTHLAGIVAADGGVDKKGIFGMAPEALLNIYKVCENNGFCLADDIASAIKYVSDLKENKSHIILLGFGSAQNSPLVETAIKYALDKNILIIAPAGNNGPLPNSVDYPAFLKEVLSVGYTNQKNDVAKESSRGLNPGPTPYFKEEGEIEVVAPGVNIESTWLNGEYKTLSGSSQAAAYIAGLAAKLWTENELSALKTRKVINDLALFNDLPPQGDDTKSGFGIPKLQKFEMSSPTIEDSSDKPVL